MEQASYYYDRGLDPDDIRDAIKSEKNYAEEMEASGKNIIYKETK